MPRKSFEEEYLRLINEVVDAFDPPLMHPLPKPDTIEEHALFYSKQGGRTLLIVAYGDRGPLYEGLAEDKIPLAPMPAEAVIKMLSAYLVKYPEERHWSVQQHLNVIKYLATQGYKFDVMPMSYEIVPAVIAYKDSAVVNALLVAELDEDFNPSSISEKPPTLQ